MDDSPPRPTPGNQQSLVQAMIEWLIEAQDTIEQTPNGSITFAWGLPSEEELADDSYDEEELDQLHDQLRITFNRLSDEMDDQGAPE